MMATPSIRVEFSLWLATTTRRAHLTKTTSMPAVPRVGDFVKFVNAELGDYFAWRVSEVTYREATGAYEVATATADGPDQGVCVFDSEAELDEYFHSYLAEGWQSERGIVLQHHLAAGS